jgi:hypothetical protein
VEVLAGTVAVCDSGEWITRGNESSLHLGQSLPREILEVLERSDQDRAAAIGRLHLRDDAAWLAELLMDLEDDVGEIARLRLVAGVPSKGSPGGSRSRELDGDTRHLLSRGAEHEGGRVPARRRPVSAKR